MAARLTRRLPESSRSRRKYGAPRRNGQQSGVQGATGGTGRAEETGKTGGGNIAHGVMVPHPLQ